jgi:glyoxylase-like metal-dependent hydrolase (beta-lactamase superfamily II)
MSHDTAGLRDEPQDPGSSGFFREVADGVFGSRIPIPGRLCFVNVWLIREADGYALIDCGSDTPAGRSSWDALLNDALAGAPIRRIFVTHGHHDHVGLARTLSDRFDAPVFMTRSEWQKAVLRAGGVLDDEQSGRFLRSHGCTPQQVVSFQASRAHGARFMRSVPASFVCLENESEIDFGGRGWRILTGGGHSPEPAMFWCEADRLLIAGDQLLPRLTPFIGVEDTEPYGDPLGDFLDSLDTLAAIGDDHLVLPGHGQPFRGPASRAAATRLHHEERFSEIEAGAASAMTAIAFAARLFPRAMDGDHARLALSETIAHLNHLVRTGRLARELDQSGVIHFLRA